MPSSARITIRNNVIKTRRLALSALCATVLGGCASEPMGPTVSVMPAPNKPFEAFQQDQTVCKEYASQQVAGQADSANERGVGAALLSTALGAGLGAAVGGGRGAGTGAALGGVVGTGIGGSSSANAQFGIQRQYNNAYGQCMYSKGNQTPGYRAEIPASPPPGYYPVPQPGY